MMFVIIVIFTLVNLFYEVNKTFSLGHFISIQVLFYACFFLFVLLDPLLLGNWRGESPGYVALLFVAMVSLFIASRMIPYDVADEGKHGGKNILRVYKLDTRFLNFGAAVYVIYLIYGIMSVVILKGSISNVFLESRLDGGGLNPNARLLLMVMIFFKILFYIRIYRLFKRRKHFLFLLFYIIPMLHHQFTATTRFDFVIFILILCILYFRKYIVKTKVKPKLSLRKFGLFLIPLAIIVFSYMYISNAVRHGLLDGEKDYFALSTVANADLSSDLQYYVLMRDLYFSNIENLNGFEYGASWFFYPIITFLPRAVWEDKPLTAFSTRYTERLYWKLGDGPVATFTIFGEGYMQFGYMGVLVSALLFAKIRYWSIGYLKRLESSRIVVLLTIFSMITYFRAEIPITYALLDVLYVMIIIRYASRIG